MKAPLWMIGVVLLFCGTASAQQLAGIELLPGYQHERTRSADSRSGRIWKDNGLEIRYDIGSMAGDRASSASNVLWSKERMIGANRARIAMTRERMLIVTFTAATRGPRGGPGAQLPANFFASVKTEEDVSDMLFMVLTYAGVAPAPQ